MGIWLKEKRLGILVKEMVLRNFLARGTEAVRNKVILDMSKVTHVDPAGMGEMIASYMRLLDGGGKLKLLSPPPKFLELLIITGLLSSFEIFDNEDEAVKSFK